MFFWSVSTLVFSFLCLFAFYFWCICKLLSSDPEKILNHMRVCCLFISLTIRCIFYTRNTIADVVLDTPEADQVLGRFFARAVADEILAPSFITRRNSITGIMQPVSPKTSVSSSPTSTPTESSKPSEQSRTAVPLPEKALSAIKKAKALIKSPQGLERLVHVWGANGAHSPMDELISKIQQFLSEYNITGDLDEAVLCVRELRATSFHHQVVYEAILLVIDSCANEGTLLRMSSLLRRLSTTGVVSESQLAKGIQRVLDSIADIQLDAPRAILYCQYLWIDAIGIHVLCADALVHVLVNLSFHSVLSILAHRFLDSLCRLSQSFFPEAICVTVAQMSNKTVQQAKGRRRTISEKVPVSTKYWTARWFELHHFCVYCCVGIAAFLK